MIMVNFAIIALTALSHFIIRIHFSGHLAR